MVSKPIPSHSQPELSSLCPQITRSTRPSRMRTPSNATSPRAGQTSTTSASARESSASTSPRYVTDRMTEPNIHLCYPPFACSPVRRCPTSTPTWRPSWLTSTCCALSSPTGRSSPSATADSATSAQSSSSTSSSTNSGKAILDMYDALIVYGAPSFGYPSHISV